MAERAEAGAPHGPPSYGWRREQVLDDQGRRLGSRDVIHPEQAQIVQEMAQAVLAGDSLRALAAELNRRGEVTVTGKPWNANALKLVLLRPRNIGMRVHQGQVVGRGTWEPILDEQTHQRLVAMLTDPSRRTSTGTTVKYLLSGLAKCGVCGSGMRVLIAGKDGRKSDSYTCFAGYHVRRSREGLEALVTGLVTARLARPDAAALLSRTDDGQAQEAADKAAALRARLDTAADAYAEGTIDGPQLTRITAKLRPELEKWQQISRASSTAPDLLDLAGPDIADRWESLPLARKRGVIDLLLDISVLPATRHGGHNLFDPESVRITWKTDH